MFNIECYDVDKKDYDLEKYSSIKEVKFWHFYEGSGKKMSRFYRQNDHLELIIDKSSAIISREG